jgi:predicted DNA-binding transcriptional regulator AlpA
MLGLNELAEVLGVSRSSVFRYLKREDFPEPALRLGRSNGWSLAAVERWKTDHLPVPRGRPSRRPEH